MSSVSEMMSKSGEIKSYLRRVLVDFCTNYPNPDCNVRAVNVKEFFGFPNCLHVVVRFNEESTFEPSYEEMANYMQRLPFVTEVVDHDTNCDMIRIFELWFNVM